MAAVASWARIPVAEWHLLAFLHVKGGSFNAARVKTAAGAAVADLVELEDRELLAARRGDRDVLLRDTPCLPLVTVRLTPAGVELAAAIARTGQFLAEVKRRRSMTLRQCGGLGWSVHDLRELEGCDLIAATPPDGRPRLVRIDDAGKDGHVSVTALGGHYALADLH